MNISKTRNFFLKSFFLFFLVVTSCTINRHQEQIRYITVNGHGTVNVAPDRAYITFAVITQHRVAQNAAQANANAMSNIIDALRGIGIRDSYITSSEYTINRQGNLNSAQGIYIATNTINVEIQNTDMIGILVDTAISSGATYISSLSFDSSDKDTHIRQARTLAVQDAQNAASLFAGASGCSVGNVISLVENNCTYFPDTNSKNAVQSSANTAIPVLAEKIEITSDITITYALQ